MKYLAVIASLVFFANFCLAQETYHSEEGHFSYTPPEGWEVIPVESMSSDYKEVLERFEDTVAIVKLKNQNGFPLMIIQAEERNAATFKTATQRATKQRWHEKLVIGGRGYGSLLRIGLTNKCNWIESGNFIFPESWRGEDGVTISGSKLSYNKDRYAAIGFIKIDNGTSEEIIFGSIVLLGYARTTIFTCFWSGQDSADFFNLFDKVIDSFSYDDGYKFYINKLENTTGTRTASYEKVSSMIGKNSVVLEFIVGAVIFAICLWIGMKVTNEEGSFFALLLISALASLAGLVPVAGFILAPIIMYVLLTKALAIEMWPDAVIIVVIANAIEMAAGAVIIANIAG